MNNRKTLINVFLGLLLIASDAKAQNWDVSLIPDSLKNGRQVSVVRLYDVSYKASSPTEGICHYHSVVTILNKRGDNMGSWMDFFQDGHETLGSFSGKLYDAKGDIIKKIKQKEISNYRISEHIATDTQRSYVESPSVVSYPYTIEYEWDVKYTNGVISYPLYSPLNGEYQSFQGGTYTLSINSGTEIDYRVSHLPVECEKTTSEGYDVYKWTVPARNAIISDSYEEEAFYRYPKILAHPRSFSYGKYPGRMDSWTTLGDWSCGLAKDRDVLPLEEKEKVHLLTDNLSTNKEKIEALYNYLGKKSRYVAINLGIGGWQPMTATEVSKTGFGDCKALSNFMHSMLKEIGIGSDLVLISTRYKDLLPDFPNFMQLNHMILCVPEPDTLWIDCTASSILPFGTVPTSLRGNECILVKPEGSEIARIPAMKDGENKYKMTADIILDESLNMKSAHYSSNCYGRYFQSMIGLEKKDDKAKSDAVNDIIDLGNCKLSNVVVKSVTDSIPYMNIECDFTASYGRKNGSRLFIPANPFTSVSKPKFKEGRTTPIVVRNTMLYEDCIKIHIPEGVTVEGIPSSEALITEFGSMAVVYKQTEDNVLEISQMTVLKSGRYSIEKKDEFIQFYEKVHKSLASTIVLKKN